MASLFMRDGETVASWRLDARNTCLAFDAYCFVCPFIIAHFVLQKPYRVNVLTYPHTRLLSPRSQLDPHPLTSR